VVLVVRARSTRTVDLGGPLRQVVVPRLSPKTDLRYPGLLASVGTVIARERRVRWSSLMAEPVRTFTMFWTALTFFLSAPPFSYSVGVIGMFGLVGLAGAVAAQRAGRLHDRGWSVPATGLRVAADAALVRPGRVRGAVRRPAGGGDAAARRRDPVPEHPQPVGAGLGIWALGRRGPLATVSAAR